MGLKACALNTGPDFHLLDHIAPLASLLSIPLIVTEPENEQLASAYYPEVEVRYWPDIERRLGDLAAEFNALIECKYWLPHLKNLFKTLYHKEMRLIFCPHGQSDKGYRAPLLAPYTNQDAVLLYGNLLKTMLVELDLWPSIQRAAFVGNYRAAYYKIHRARLQKQTDAEIFSKLNPRNRTLLYAPTWADADGASTFFAQIENLARAKTCEWNVIVKVHPLLRQRQPAEFYRLDGILQKKANWILVDEFPLVLPVIDRIDAYLGDYSSVGYDVLMFEKPMFFFTQPHLPQIRIHSCGTVLDPLKPIFPAIERGIARDFRAQQRALANEAFAPVPDLRDLIQSLMAEEYTRK